MVETVNLLRTAVGAPNLEVLLQRQEAYSLEWPDGIVGPALHTRRWPRRVEDLLAGGSVYWIVKGQIQARQRILAIDAVEREEGSPVCRVRMALPVIRVLPMTQRAVQGWRYLPVDKAPPDLEGDRDSELPPHMVAELRSLGIW